MIFGMFLDTFNSLGFRHTQIEIPIILRKKCTTLRLITILLSITPSLMSCILIQSSVTFIALNATPSHLVFYIYIL